MKGFKKTHTLYVRRLDSRQGIEKLGIASINCKINCHSICNGFAGRIKRKCLCDCHTNNTDSLKETIKQFPSNSYEGIIICRCGHGKIHHNGKYGQCTCDVGKYKNEKLCSCQTLDVVKEIFKGQITVRGKGIA